MVNTFTMNIDVREYLRINPISVHELTLSGDGKDCFLYFPPNNQTGYEVLTQIEMFWSIYQSIFCNLIEGTQDNFRLKASIDVDVETERLVINWNPNIHLATTQFTDYVRDHWHEGDTIPNWGGFQEDFEERLHQLEVDVDAKLFELRKLARVEYSGAVELQSSLALKCKLLFRDLETRADTAFGYGTGLIWAHSNGSSDVTSLNSVEIPTVLIHGHDNTKAEAMTTSFASNRGGGQLVGEFTIGNQTRVSKDASFNAAANTSYNMVSYRMQGTLTYPLFGENVLDWRNPQKSHNNIPPSSNIWIRYKIHEDAKQTRAVGQEFEETMRAVSDSQAEIDKVVEAQYQSSMVCDLESYRQQNLTQNDCLLRMTLDGMGEDVKMMRQGVQMLLDIYAEQAAARLGREVTRGGLTLFATLSDIMQPILDAELVMKQRFLAWYREVQERLLVVSDKIKQIREMLTAMKPVVYVGKIIMSTTDDTEEKVISKYGGKRWRMTVNFLRGVSAEDANMGKKLGEEYVCLRESNVPIHTHQVKLLGATAAEDAKPATTGPGQWIQTNKTGAESKMVNSPSGEIAGTALRNDNLDYQISPMEYTHKKGVTIPHDNLPPYREVYIWECLEITDEEMEVIHAIIGSFIVEWIPNNG